MQIPGQSVGNSYARRLSDRPLTTEPRSNRRLACSLLYFRLTMTSKGYPIMIRKTFICTAALGALAITTPAHATWGSWWSGSKGGHKHYAGCGHSGTTSTSSSTTTTGGYTSTTSTSSGGSTTTSTTSGGTTSTSGGTTGGSTSSTSGGSTSTSSGGTSVPEPGMLGLMGIALFGIGAAARRKRRTA